MRLLRSATAIGLAKAVYDQARKPANQIRIKNAVAALRGADHSSASKGRSRRRTR